MRLALALCAAAALLLRAPEAGVPRPDQKAAAEMRIAIREGDVATFLHWCDRLGDTCVTQTGHLGNKLLHTCAEAGRYSIAKYIIANLGQDPDIGGKKGQTPYQRCQYFDSGEVSGERSPQLQTGQVGCDPDTWLRMTEEAIEMRERGEKVDRATIKEATDVGMDTLGKSTREREQEQASEKQAQAERLAAYEAEQAAKPKTEAERRAERDRKRQEMQERIAAKKAAKAAEKKAKEL